jgi:integrase
MRAKQEAERRYWARVDAARAVRSGQPQKKPSEATAQSLAVDWFRRELDGFEDLLDFAQRSPEALDQALEDAAEQLASQRRELAEERGGSYALKIARSIAESCGLEDVGHFLPRLIQRARIALTEIFQARLVSDYGTRPGDPLFASALETPPASAEGDEQVKTQRTLGDLIAAFRAAKWEELRPSSRTSYEKVFQTLRDLVGESRALVRVSRDEARQVFETVKALPRGYGKGKRWEGIDTKAAVAEGRREGLPVIAAKTVNGTYMGLTASLFQWAVTEGWIDHNAFKGLRVKDRVAARDKRDPFTSRQLSTLFGSPPWLPRDSASKGQPIRYWLPLFALWQGMRLGEIAQLRVLDFRKDDGVHVFEVRGDLKNENARRTLPVHPELERLGVLAYVAERRAAGKELLFDEVQDKRGKWGVSTGRWFSRLVATHRLKGRRLGLHSLRHNFEDALRNAGLHGTALGSALAGRRGGDPVAGGYGRGFSARQLHGAIEKVRYDGFPALPAED